MKWSVLPTLMGARPEEKSFSKRVARLNLAAAFSQQKWQYPKASVVFQCPPGLGRGFEDKSHGSTAGPTAESHPSQWSQGRKI